jgi:hypothetical protein
MVSGQARSNTQPQSGRVPSHRRPLVPTVGGGKGGKGLEVVLLSADSLEAQVLDYAEGGVG